MPRANTELELLFGLIAIQNDLIDRDAVVAGCRAWSREKCRPLAEHLVNRGDLDPDDRNAA
jgi:hypothetical protein